MSDRKIPVLFFAHAKDGQVKVEASWSWTELVTKLLVIGEKPLRSGGKKAQICWMPARLKAGEKRRLKANVEGAHVLILDFDGGTDIEALHELWHPWDHWIHTTWSHDPEGQGRYRVLIPLDAEASPKLYPKLWHWAEKRCHSAGIKTADSKDKKTEGLDPQTKNINRVWFVPFALAGFESRVHTGELGALNIAHVTTGVFKGEADGDDATTDKIDGDLIFNTGTGRTSVATWAVVSKPGDKIQGHCPEVEESSFGCAFLRRRKRGVLLVCTSAKHGHPRPLYRWWPDPKAGDDTLGPDRAMTDKLLWTVDKDGNRAALKPAQHNLNLILTEDARWKNRLWRDQFSGRDFVDERPYENEDDIDVRAWVERAYGVSFPIATINTTAHWAAKKTLRNTLLEAINEYRWDGVARLDDWLIRAFGCVNTPLHRWIGRSFLVQAAARALTPGCVAQYVMVLVGDQGEGKSMGLRALAGDAFFSDTRFAIDSKEAYMQIRGTWIYEFAELASVRGYAQLDAVKAYLTSPDDTYVPKFRNEPVTVPRTTVFVGSVNDDEFLHDYTGNRRFWPVRIGSIDVPWITEHREALWAEALEAARAGEQAWPEGDIKEQLADHTSQFMEIDAWQQPIVEWLRRCTPPAVTTEVLAEHVLDLPPARQSRKEQMRIGKILRLHGYRRERVSTRRYGRIYAFLRVDVGPNDAQDFLDLADYSENIDDIDNVVGFKR